MARNLSTYKYLIILLETLLVIAVLGPSLGCGAALLLLPAPLHDTIYSCYIFAQATQHRKRILMQVVWCKDPSADEPVPFEIEVPGSGADGKPLLIWNPDRHPWNNRHLDRLRSNRITGGQTGSLGAKQDHLGPRSPCCSYTIIFTYQEKPLCDHVMLVVITASARPKGF